MKVKDIPEFRSLTEIKVKIPKKFEDRYMGVYGDMFIYSYWQKGVWFKKRMKDSQVYPLTMENPKDILEWDVIN